MSTRTRFAALFALAVVGALAVQHAATAAEGTKAIRWVDDIGTAKEIADATGKPILIVFGADWCGYCKKLDKETLSHPAVANYVNQGFVPVHLDLDREKWAARVLEVKTLPCTVVLAPNADQLGRIVGFEEATPFYQKLAGARKLQDRLAAAATGGATR